MNPLLCRALLPLGMALVAAGCTTPARTDSGALPAVTTTVDAEQPGTTASLPAAPSTTLPARGPDIVAWLTGDAIAGPLAAAIEGWNGVSRVALVGGEDALAEFTALYADRPDLVAGVDPTALPTSLRIEIMHPSFLPEVAAQLRSLADVEEVATAVTPACNAFPGWNVIVFVSDDRELTRIRNELAAAEGVSGIEAFGREAAYQEFIARFDGAGHLAGSIAVQDMSVSLRARSSNPVTLTVLADRFAADWAVTGVHVFPPGAPDCS